MIYLDYSATTPVEEEVLETFVTTCRNYPANPNSLHQLGSKARGLMDAAIAQIATLLGVSNKEVIFTSGASEANNLAFLGVLEKYPKRAKRIITTKLEHSSVLECVSYLETKGYEVCYVNILENGLIDIVHLQHLLQKETALVSIHHVNSEVGICQDIEAIGNLLKNYQTTIFHVDGTQAVGKISVSLQNVDLYSFSFHKIYGLKGSGCLIKKDKVELVPMIHGGKSQTIYRSGTPPLALITSGAKALRLALTNLEKKEAYVKELNCFLKSELKKIEGITINSAENAIPHIVNISVTKIKPETLLHALEKEEIYLSTKTACAKDNSASLSLLAIGKEEMIAKHSLRISLSHKTTKNEIDFFIKKLKQAMKELTF